MKYEALHDSIFSPPSWGERGCRTKITTQVADADKLLHQYSYGLHRVIFYGDHTRDVERLSKLLGFKVVYEM